MPTCRTRWPAAARARSEPGPAGRPPSALQWRFPAFRRPTMRTTKATHAVERLKTRTGNPRYAAVSVPGDLFYLTAAPAAASRSSARRCRPTSSWPSSTVCRRLRRARPASSTRPSRTRSARPRAETAAAGALPIHGATRCRPAAVARPGSPARLPRSPPSRVPRGLARRHPAAASGRSDGEAFGTIGHSISPLTAAPAARPP